MTFTPMIADACISFRVNSETKALLRRMALRDGLTDSAFVKRLLDGAISRTAPFDAPVAPVSERLGRDTRLHVCITADDWQRLAERARARGMATATYAAFVIRAHLRHAAPIPQTEYLVLKEAILELTAIGRNLNQIARAVNAGEKACLPGRAEVRAMVRVAQGLRRSFKALLEANERTWRSNETGS